MISTAATSTVGAAGGSSGGTMVLGIGLAIKNIFTGHHKKAMANERATLDVAEPAVIQSWQAVVVERRFPA